VVDGEKRYDARAHIRARMKLQKKKAKKEDTKRIQGACVFDVVSKLLLVQEAEDERNR
jgi:hypothetical protein